MAGKVWSSEEDAYIRDNYLTMSCEEMAKSLPGRTTRAVQHRFAFLGLERPLAKAGDVYGRLTIIRIEMEDIGTQMRAKALVKCSCDGREKWVRVNALRDGTTVSCGCNKAEKAAERCKTLSRTHGKSGTRLHRIWNGMRARCNFPGHSAYADYGGRGIRVCDEWGQFEVFAAWADAAGYDDVLSLDRVDVNGNYEPGNVRWSDRKAKARNKRSNRRVTAWGETKAVCEWLEDPRCLAVTPEQVTSRLGEQGWSPEDALSRPVGPQGKEGRERSVEDVLYSVWNGMVSRCHNINHVSYGRYGAKGVAVCDEWRDFPAFFRWALANGWASGLSIDRINSASGYRPDNCRWVAREEQARNKVSTLRLKAFGEEKTPREWALDPRCLCPEKTIRYRVSKLGWEPERAITTPVRKGR